MAARSADACRVMRILITGARAPVAMHLCRHLSAAGHQVWLADTPAFPISRATGFKAGYIRLPAPRGNIAAYGEAVAGAVAQYGIDLIIPTCEEVFYLAAVRERIGGAVFAPGLEALKAVHNKAQFAGLSRGFGADAPQTHRLETLADMAVAAVRPGQWIYKPVWSRFGARVLIRPDAVALSALRPTPDEPWVQQAYLPGEELCCYAVAHHGRVVALQAYRPLWRAGAQGIGAGVFVEPFDEPVIAGFVAGFAAANGWHGQISFDFRRDEAGALHVIECNPRAVTGALFFGRGDALAAAIADGAEARPTRDAPLSIALAMILFALPDAVRRGRLNDWRRDMGRFAPMLDWPGDKGTAGMQALALTETIATAVTGGQGLRAAATADIEWNGEAL
jgi:hypothetical protein